MLYLQTDFIQAAHVSRTIRLDHIPKSRYNTTIVVGPIGRRHGSYLYSNSHSIYKSCYYEGGWMNGKPHGW